MIMRAELVVESTTRSIGRKSQARVWQKFDILPTKQSTYIKYAVHISYITSVEERDGLRKFDKTI